MCMHFLAPLVYLNQRMHEWIVIISWAGLSWKAFVKLLQVLDDVMSFVFVLYVGLLHMGSCFPSPIEGGSLWGCKSAGPLVGVPGGLSTAPERKAASSWPRVRGETSNFGSRPTPEGYWRTQRCHSPGTCSGSCGLSEQCHTLACFQTPSFLPRWIGKEGFHLTPPWAVHTEEVDP